MSQGVGVVGLYVRDQDEAHEFYVGKLGFRVHTDVKNGDYRWLTVTSPGSAEILLAKNTDPAAAAYQKALFAQHQPAVMFYAGDLKAEHARIAAKGGTFTRPPTEVMPGSTIAQLEDGCGNLIQLTQLDR